MLNVCIIQPVLFILETLNYTVPWRNPYNLVELGESSTGIFLPGFLSVLDGFMYFFIHDCPLYLHSEKLLVWRLTSVHSTVYISGGGGGAVAVSAAPTAGAGDAAKEAPKEVEKVILNL